MTNRIPRPAKPAAGRDTRVMAILPGALAFVVAGTTLAAIGIAGCDGGCTKVGCINGAAIVAHLPVDRRALTGGGVKLCLGERCGYAVLGQVDSGVSDDFSIATLRGDFLGDVSIEQVATGWTHVQARPELDDGEVHEGDRYTLRIESAEGKNLLDFSRGVHYSSMYPNGPQCDDGCRVSRVDAWASSQSGLTCGGESRPSTAELSLRCAHFSGALTLRVCRNDDCAEKTWREISSGTTGYVTDHGPLTYRFTLSSGKLRVSVVGEPSLLADGDHYAVTATAADGTIVAGADAIATYEESYPTGPGCDTYPSRTFSYVEK